MFWLLLAFHVGIWTCFATLTHGAIHHDMAEAWAWGQEWQAGYVKHPPLSAWLAGAWFQIFPHTNWAYFLLSAVNGAVALAGAWATAGLLLERRARWAAILLLMLTPFYGVQAQKFNANAALLPLWSWTGYAFVRMLATRSRWDAVLLGLLAGLALLGKYYAVVLLASLMLAALVHPDRWPLLRSALSYTAAAVTVVVLLPHALWMIGTGFPTIDYAITKTQRPVVGVLLRGLSATLLVIGSHALAFVVLVAVFSRHRRSLFARLRIGLRRRATLWLVAVAALPVILTLLACIVVNVRISSQFMMPIFALVPTTVLVLTRIVPSAAEVRRLVLVVTGGLTLVALLSPLIAVALFHRDIPTWREPTPALAADATKLWREAFARRLDVVSGERVYSQSIAFYSPDRPSDFTRFNLHEAPWITRERLRRSGFLAVCRSEDADCIKAAERWLTAGSKRFQRSYPIRLWHWQVSSPKLTLILVAPARPAAGERPDATPSRVRRF